MRQRLILLTLFLVSLSMPVFGQAKVEGNVTNDRGHRVPSARFVLTPGGQAATTDSKGHFIISLPGNIQPGQAAQLRVDKVNWVVFNPLFGNCTTQNAERNVEPLRVVIVPKGSPLSYEPKRLSQFVGALQKQVAKQHEVIGAMKGEVDKARRERQAYAFLLKYAEEYGLPLDRLKSELDEWAQLKESDDKLERARKEYWLRNLEKVTELTNEAAPVYVDKLKRVNKQRLEDINKVIGVYTLEGNAYYEQFKFSDALRSFSALERLFASREIPREDFTEEWAEVKLSLGNTKGELGTRSEGASGPRLLAEALEDLRQAETFYTRDRFPQQWATTHNNLGIVLRILGEHVSGDESAGYLNEAAATLRRTLEVRTRVRFPREWAGTQNNLGVVLRTLGERVGGDESAKYLSEAEAAYRAASEVYTREQFPQDWASIQNNLGAVLRGIGVRSRGDESTRLLHESATAYRDALKIVTRDESPADWAKIQNNLGIALRDLGEQVGGAESIKYLHDALAAHRAALEAITRHQSPQEWATVQNNLGIVLFDLGERVVRVESINYLNDSVAAYRAALEVRTRAHLPQQWAVTQNNLSITLRVVGSPGTELEFAL